MVLRPSDGALVVLETSDAKLHRNGAPYQFGGKGWQTDYIEDGLTSSFDVQADDVVLCFTVGLNGNLEAAEIARIGSACTDCATMAATLVDRARSAGRVDDDTTVIALRLGDGAWVGGDAIRTKLPDEAPWEKFGFRPW